MRDCANVKVRELLPDLIHGRLAAAERVEVETHLARCEDCRAELLILRRVVAASVTRRMDVSRIVATLPPYRRMSMWYRVSASPQFRVAAAVVVLVGGAAVVSTVSRNGAKDPIRAPVELAVGEPLHDLLDTELRALLNELASLEAVTSSETDVVEPSLGRGGA